MRLQIEGSQAVAAAVALCRPEVISCYPITPQTHIVERLSELVRKGEIGSCRFLNAESEFGALSILIGASAAGARTYTATASQGLLFMAEAVYNASGLGLPIVMTIGNRAIGAPINIWNDHSDSMALRDAGWIQLHAESNQEAVDLHIQAFRLAEALSCPVMVCMDGFILTHAYEPVDLPAQEQVDGFLPPFEPIQLLDPDDPMTIGAMVGPEAFAEVRYLTHHTQLRALEEIAALKAEFLQRFGRSSGGLVERYRTEDAETILVALGSVNGTIREVVDELRDAGVAVGSLKIGTYRPFPVGAVREALHPCRRTIVVEKDLALGKGGIVSSDIKMALRGLPVIVQTVIAGLGGRSITRASLLRMINEARAGKLDEPHFLDLNWDVVRKELARRQQRRRAGPTAEHVLRQVNSVASKLV
ncbi:MAG TPA: pyruvate ferredoxin oxidoreductase [Nitrospiria bacterium]|nr:pyruvate ferredoxin oxidoreductase [Nitrospiria bacterium]